MIDSLTRPPSHQRVVVVPHLLAPCVNAFRPSPKSGTTRLCVQDRVCGTGPWRSRPHRDCTTLGPVGPGARRVADAITPRQWAAGIRAIVLAPTTPGRHAALRFCAAAGRPAVTTTSASPHGHFSPPSGSGERGPRLRDRCVRKVVGIRRTKSWTIGRHSAARRGGPTSVAHIRNCGNPVPPPAMSSWQGRTGSST